jgi:hypothetical protein
MGNNFAFGENEVVLISDINISGGTTSNNLASLVFNNSPSVTFGLDGSTITASAAGGGGGGGSFSAGASNLGNTLGNTGTVSNQIVFAGGNNITVSQSTNAGGATLTISAFNQSVQTQAATIGQLSVGASTDGNTNGNTTVNTGQRLVFVGSNMISVSQATAAGSTTLVFSATQSVQTQAATIGQVSLGLSNLGNTQGNTTVNTGNRFVLVGTNGITLSQATGAGSTTISISGNAAQTVQTQGITGDQLSIGVSNLGNTQGNTTVNSGNRFVLVGTNGITISQATGAGSTTISISGNAAQTVQTQSLIAGVYDGANSISTGTIRFTNANGVSFSINGQTISASVLAQSNQILTMFANSNTTQSSTGTANASSLNFVGAGIASVGISGGSVIVSVPSGGGAGDGGVFAGVSTGGNTAGSTGTVSTGNFVLVGSNGITLSQSTGAAGSAATVTILGDAATLNFFAPWPAIGHSQLAVQNASLKFAPIQVQNFVTATVLRHFGAIALTTSSNSSWGGTISIHYGIYTKNASTLSLASSGSISYAFTNTSNNSTSVLSGQKNFSVPINLSMTPGDYWVGFVVRTSTVNANSWAMSNGQLTVGNSNFSGDFMVATNATNQRQLGLGVYSVSVSTLPASVGFSELSGTAQSSQYSQVFAFGTL